MRITYGTINLRKPTSPVCITSNDFITKRGRAVMGRGIAKEAKNIFKGIDYKMANSIIKHPGQVDRLNKWLIRFPVKPDEKLYTKPEDVVKHARAKYKKGNIIPGFHCVADIRIIQRSAKQLMALIDKENIDRVILPRPGCGAGELSWGKVLDVLYPILDDRVEVRTFRPSNNKVFISGSHTIKGLTKNVKKAILDHIHRDDEIVIGDCHGVDSLVQDFCKSLGYTNVMVYHIGNKPRYNAGFMEVEVSGNRYFMKDIVMGDVADSLLVIWDGKSKGSKANMDRAIREGKPVKLWCAGKVIDVSRLTTF